MKNRNCRAFLFGAGMVLAASPFSAFAQTIDPPDAAGAWSRQELDLDLVEYTAVYSCDGLHGKMQVVLQTLGAMPGAELTEFGCMEPGIPGTRMPTVRMRFSSLQPKEGGGTVRGAWKTVNLVGRGKLDDTECELAQAIARQLLSRFTVRNVQTLPSCFPHSQTRVPSFRLDVFAPAQMQQ